MRKYVYEKNDKSEQIHFFYSFSWQIKINAKNDPIKIVSKNKYFIYEVG